MPTVIALDLSLSMIRNVPSNNSTSTTVETFHTLSVHAINQFLDYLTANSKLEYVSLVVYSSLYEVVVEFTRDYEKIRKALQKLEHYDKTCLEPVLQGINSYILSTWGTQNYAQILLFTDCGVGFRNSSVNEIVNGLIRRKQIHDSTIHSWLPFACPSMMHVICLGNLKDEQFRNGTILYQNMLDFSGQAGQLYIAKTNQGGEEDNYLTKGMLEDMVNRVCEGNYKQFEAVLNCGSYFKLESSIVIWPSPLPYKMVDSSGKQTVRNISKRFEVCGFINISDIGSPMSISRHLVLPKITDSESDKTEAPTKSTDLERLDSDIKAFYAKQEANSDDESPSASVNDANKESACVLLHGALKVENMAALVLLNQNWYGFMYSFADNKKKSNLMLMVLQPGSDIIPWLGDFKMLTTASDTAEKGNFPVKPEKRSYSSQNCVVWIRQAGLQSDIQKILRHAKKLPEKTQHFYKELNRIRRAALSLGFIELLEGLSVIFEREISALPSNTNPECALQLKHAATELRKPTNRDHTKPIVPFMTKFN